MLPCCCTRPRLHRPLRGGPHVTSCCRRAPPRGLSLCAPRKGEQCRPNLSRCFAQSPPVARQRCPEEAARLLRWQTTDDGPQGSARTTVWTEQTFDKGERRVCVSVCEFRSVFGVFLRMRWMKLRSPTRKKGQKREKTVEVYKQWNNSKMNDQKLKLVLSIKLNLRSKK